MDVQMKLNAKCITALAITVLFLLFAVSGCARRGTVILENEEGRVIIESKEEKSYSDEEEPYYPRKVVKIPKGHMPPPGKCRIWYPDRPPGHQPPPGDCEDLRNHVPSSAWLIRG
jgi:hypothetical protein